MRIERTYSTMHGLFICHLVYQTVPYQYIHIHACIYSSLDSLIWLDDKLEQISKVQQLLGEAEPLHLPPLVVIPANKMGTDIDDTCTDICTNIAASKETITVAAGEGASARTESWNVTLKKLITDDMPFVVKPRNGANGHGVRIFESPQQAGEAEVFGAVQTAAKLDATILVTTRIMRAWLAC
jgi:hypothetical protein